ncbi:MAG: sulfurtransferase-like selenium metabolism protein YedF [Deltaproteobacteria bacterium]|nr:sulfurtransferase-like selenium metabolism protein YedF [Deltaproteobacteria bacterium]
MKIDIDARGYPCPQPVIMAKKALDERGRCNIFVDTEEARDNIMQLADSRGCSVEIAAMDNDWILNIEEGAAPRKNENDFEGQKKEQMVFLIPSETMGRGNEELGNVLMKAFFHTITERDVPPDVCILINTGVRLAVEGSQVLDDLKALERRGVKLLVCGTCLSYFGFAGKLCVGAVSNMYDIVERLCKAGRIIAV